jgi:hypothetical protein
MRGHHEHGGMGDCDHDRDEGEGAPPPCHHDGPHGAGPGAHFGGPPPEIFEACNGKKAGDECVVKRDDWEMKSVCGAPPHGAADGRLACVPGGRPKGPPPAPAAEGAKPAAPPAKPKK